MKKPTAAELGAQGGKIRAANLSKTRRTEIAQKAALTRWGGTILRATHGDPDHPLIIGGAKIPCYVLEDGQRVLSLGGMIRSLGMSVGTAGGGDGDRLASFVTGKSVSPFISKDLLNRIKSPVRFQAPTGGVVASGYEATILADLCDAVLEARKANALRHMQIHIGAQCEILVRGFARVGIIALVDEATGYQNDRERFALARILEQFVAKEYRKWVRTFPLEYYRELCRIRGVPFPTGTPIRLPGYFGHLTNDLIYARLAPGVLAELRRKNPVTESGSRKRKHFQWLTEEIGDPRLREHLWRVITLMQVYSEWDAFYLTLERILPRFSDQPLLAMIEYEAATGSKAFVASELTLPASQSPSASQD